MSVPEVVLISRVNVSNKNIANLDVSKIEGELQVFNSLWWLLRVFMKHCRWPELYEIFRSRVWAGARNF